MISKNIAMLVKGLLIGWLACIYTLHPFPWHEVNYFDENRSAMREIIVLEAKHQGRKLSDSETVQLLESQIALEKSRIWKDWGLHVIAVILGIASCVLYLWRHNARWPSWCVVAASFGYLGLWTAPYLSRKSSLVDSYLVVASGVFATGSVALFVGFVVFNVILPMLNMTAVLVLAWRATLMGNPRG